MAKLCEIKGCRRVARHIVYYKGTEKHVCCDHYNELSDLLPAQIDKYYEGAWK